VTRNRVVVVDNAHMAELLGYNDTVIRVIEKAYPQTSILVRGNEISLEGSSQHVDAAATAIEELRGILAAGAPLNAEVARETVRMLRGASEVGATATAVEKSVAIATETPTPVVVPDDADPVATPTSTAPPEPAEDANDYPEPFPPERPPMTFAAEPDATPTPPAASASDTSSTPRSDRPAQVLSRSILSSRGRTIRSKTEGQGHYVDAIEQNTITFGIGPAGTGKTYLAMAQAVAALQAKRVSRIVLTRPAVEAGERLGFLPGSLSDKIDPYLRPLYDALHDMIDPESIPRLMEAGTIEVAPLAYMRGRTLNDAFIILDEAQNTTREQMKMFLTRLGFGATMVVTGDVTQVDLPGGTQSGLRAASEILTGIDDIAFCFLGAEDVVRHRLVSDIITAYASAEASDPSSGSRRASRTDGQQRRLTNNGDHT